MTVLVGTGGRAPPKGRGPNVSPLAGRALVGVGVSDILISLGKASEKSKVCAPFCVQSLVSPYNYLLKIMTIKLEKHLSVALVFKFGSSFKLPGELLKRANTQVPGGA